MVKLSNRMAAVADMITPGLIVCDVGTDHGYIPIHLVSTGKNPKALAMDIRSGPLSRAEANVKSYGLSDKISTRLSDGVDKLMPGEAEALVIAGMGGEMVLHILKADEEKCRGLKELILQPQSDVEKVRRYLRLNCYKIVDENMIYEDGKYYPMFRVVPVDENPFWDRILDRSKTVCDLYGPLLLRNGNPILRKYLVKENQQLTRLLNELNKLEETDKIIKRRKELEKRLSCNEAAYSIMGEIKNAGI